MNLLFHSKFTCCPCHLNMNYPRKNFLMIDYMVNHVINHQKVLPGIIHIEITWAACELAMKKKVHKLKNIVWPRPVIVESPQQLELALSIKECGVAYQIRSR